MCYSRLLQPLLWLLALACFKQHDVYVNGVKIPVDHIPRQSNPTKLPVDLSLASSNQFAYLAHIDIGGQDFRMLLDTGSADLWVVSSDCTEQDCQGVAKYNQSSSFASTNSSFHLTYLSGSVTGLIGTETVVVGPYEISTQILALANQTSGLALAGTGNSGILGLSFPVEASIPETLGRTLLENIMASYNETERYFAIKLGRDQDGSSFTIGELDPDFANSTSDFTYNSVSPLGNSVYNYWKLPLQGFTINHTVFPLSDSRVSGASSSIAVLDTGTTLILGPSADVDRFWQSVGGAKKTSSGWQVRCDRGIIVGVVLGGGNSTKEYVIDPADISWQQGSHAGEWCMGGVQANDGVISGDWLLGDTFLRNVYALHHVAANGQPPRIGLLGLTDPDASLAAFRQQRGNDPTPPAQILTNAHQSNSLGGGDICGIAAAGGFAFGAVMTLLLCFKPCRGKVSKY
ncbi:acid protease [Obba rivulosa]|uniref:Acid protease n=1 Tax=Obba rivulosa TaxID=1052685 RepID=A0A8E2DTN7_9APHY|nr:acid protease [Obba rivulosa]